MPDPPSGSEVDEAVKVVHDHADRIFLWNYDRSRGQLVTLDANDGYLRRHWAEAGLLEFEFADDTGSDYESYDAVASDRARAARH